LSFIPTRSVAPSRTYSKEKPSPLEGRGVYFSIRAISGARGRTVLRTASASRSKIAINHAGCENQAVRAMLSSAARASLYPIALAPSELESNIARDRRQRKVESISGNPADDRPTTQPARSCTTYDLDLRASFPRKLSPTNMTTRYDTRATNRRTIHACICVFTYVWRVSSTRRLFAAR